MKLLSALGGGLWIIPLGFFLASVWSFYRAYQQWKSGSVWWEKNEYGVPVKKESDKRVPFFSIGAARYGLAFLAAAIGSFIWMHMEK